MTAIPLGRRLPGASSNLPGRPDPDIDPGAPCGAPRRPYSVLLPVGFAVPPALPPARCALTAPFHPCRGQRNAPRRSILCGTFPGFAPAGCYPAPFAHGARTFLPGNLSVSPERPPGRLTETGMGTAGVAVKGFNPSGLTQVRFHGAAKRVAVRARAAIVLARPRVARSSCNVFCVDASAMPSTRSGRKWR